MIVLLDGMVADPVILSWLCEPIHAGIRGHSYLFSIKAKIYTRCSDAWTWELITHFYAYLAALEAG